MASQDDYDATVKVNIKAPIGDVWDGITKPALIKQYMHGANVATDWKVGSQITWDGVWDDKPYQDKGKVLEVEPQKTLKYTHWSPMTGTEDKPENYHVVTLTLSEDNSTTKLVLTQNNNPSKEAADAMANKGWQPMIETLKSLLERAS
jgi:uncharacterized protein YndB with AHSA1/START domain